jgi:thiol-disulfide isomerase/thioredoxin
MGDPPPKDRTWLYVGLAFAGIWAGYLALFNPIGKPPSGAPVLETPPPGQVKMADFGWKLQDLDGKPVSLGDYRGRPILLNIWATWCPPCRAEMPTLVRLAANPRLKGVAFLGVTVENASDKVKQYAQSDMKGLTVLRGDDVPPVFASEAIPSTHVIAPDGKIAGSKVGSADWDDPSVVEFLEKLLKQPGPARP